MRPQPTKEQVDLIKPIKLLVMDVDGILTEGNLSFLADGSEIKSFNTRRPWHKAAHGIRCQNRHHYR